MAENKKSFILYSDLISTVEQLPDETAGVLLKIILRYVNDLNPVIDDLILKIAFEPIKQQLKRDLMKWDNFKIKQSENGKLGGRPNKPKPKKEKPNNPGLNSESQKSLNVTVNVNDTVNDNVSIQTNIPPTLELFLEYLKLQTGADFESIEYSGVLKYKSWLENGWKTGKDKKIGNWKSTLLNTIPYLEKSKEPKKGRAEQLMSDYDKLMELHKQQYGTENS